MIASQKGTSVYTLRSTRSRNKFLHSKHFGETRALPEFSKQNNALHRTFDRVRGLDESRGMGP
jgi:hypothetical protein